MVQVRHGMLQCGHLLIVALNFFQLFADLLLFDQQLFRLNAVLSGQVEDSAEPFFNLQGPLRVSFKMVNKMV